MRMHFNTILLLLIISVSTTLLVGSAFDAPWAGGEGQARHATVYVDEVEYHRGEIVRTETDEWVRAMIGDATVYMSERTEILLANTRPGQETITVIQGRIVSSGPLRINVRDISTQTNEITSYVHYSWEDVIDVASVEGTAIISPLNIELYPGESVNISTLPPFNTTFNAFIPQESQSEWPFYEWVFSQEEE